MFLFGKDIVRGFHLVMSMKQRKNSESPWGIEPQTFGFCVPMFYHWATETTESKVYYKVQMTQVLHTVRISNVNSIIFVNRIREMVNFELGKDIKKDVFCPIASVVQREILCPHEAWSSIPHRDFEYFLCPMLTTRQKTSFFILCLRFVFIVFILLSSLICGVNSLHVRAWN